MQKFTEFIGQNKEVVIDSTNHEARWGKNTTTYIGYYLVNQEEISDEGNTDRGWTAAQLVGKKALEALGFQADEEDGWDFIDKLNTATGKFIDSDQIKVKASGIDKNNLKFELI